MERIHVYGRLRPFLSGDAAGNDPCAWCEAKSVVVATAGSRPESTPRPSSNPLRYEFSGCLGTSQENVYEKAAKPIVDSVLEGYNGTIMAYGQTGSGKTHTMFGTKGENGIVPRVFDSIFEADSEIYEFEYTISYVQIYCEVITDLLADAQTHLNIRESKAGVFLENATARRISSVSEAMDVIGQGEARRAVAATDINKTSSRSHVCVIINALRRVKGNEENKKVRRGKLFLVDLAGSERVKRAHSSTYHHRAPRFMESKAINTSLSALGSCMAALSSKKRHIPFRDSKLTRLLQGSLGGGAKTALILTLSPEMVNKEQTVNTLQFGERASIVEVRASVNEDVDYKALYLRLQSQFDAKDARMHELELNVSKLHIENANVKEENKKLLSEKELSASEANQLREALQSELVKMRTGLASQPESETIAQDSVFGLTACESPAPTGVDEVGRLFTEQLEKIKGENQRVVDRIREECAKEKDAAISKVDIANEEWDRIEYELKDEKMEHLETLRKLREKQTQLVDLEASMGARIGDLLDQLAEKDERVEFLETRLLGAFTERKGLVETIDAMKNRTKELETVISDCHKREEDTLQLMEELAVRVEQLESVKKKKRAERTKFLPARAAPNRFTRERRIGRGVSRTNKPATRFRSASTERSKAPTSRHRSVSTERGRANDSRYRSVSRDRKKVKGSPVMASWQRKKEKKRPAQRASYMKSTRSRKSKVSVSPKSKRFVGITKKQTASSIRRERREERKKKHLKKSTVSTVILNPLVEADNLVVRNARNRKKANATYDSHGRRIVRRGWA